MEQATAYADLQLRSGSAIRQRLLVLYLASGDLASSVLAWSNYDGRGAEFADDDDAERPPYPDGVAALRDGWRLLHWPAIPAPSREQAYELGPLPFEFVFEKLEVIDV